MDKQIPSHLKDFYQKIDKPFQRFVTSCRSRCADCAIEGECTILDTTLVMLMDKLENNEKANT